jgi:hypothetical protein
LITSLTASSLLRFILRFSQLAIADSDGRRQRFLSSLLATLLMPPPLDDITPLADSPLADYAIDEAFASCR